MLLYASLMEAAGSVKTFSIFHLNQSYEYYKVRTILCYMILIL